MSLFANIMDYLQNVNSSSQHLLCARSVVGPPEVRFAHPVRLSPDTHSQGHGRPCLRRPHHRPGFYEMGKGQQMTMPT